MSVLGPKAGTVFQKSFPQVFATYRGDEVLNPIRLRYDEDGYLCGQVLAQNSVDQTYAKYDDGGASGLDTAVCVLLDDVAAADFESESATGSVTTRAVFAKAQLYFDKLIGYDTAAGVDLKARTFSDGTGTNLLVF